MKKILGITIITAIICMGLAYHKSNNIINPNNIISIQFSNKIKTDRQEIKNKDIKLIVNILNTAKYDSDFNDGKSIKIIENSLTLWIKYSDNAEVTVQFWDDRIKVNGIWYLLNINKIKKVIYWNNLELKLIDIILIKGFLFFENKFSLKKLFKVV